MLLLDTGEKMLKIKLPSFIIRLIQKRILIQFFTVFCLLIIVPVVITNNIIYFNSSKVIESEIKQYNDQIMENMIGYIDNKLWKIFNNVATVSDAGCFKTVYEREKSGNQAVLDKYDITGIREQLKQLKKSNPMIEEACIYFKSDDAVISNDGYYEIDTYFSEKKCFDNISSSQWKKLLQEKHTFEILNSQTIHEKTQSSDITSRSITLLSTISGRSGPEAAFLVFINQNSINNIIAEYSGIKKNDYYVTDSTGKPVAQYANNKLLQSKDISRMALDAAGSREMIFHKTINNGKISVTCSVSPLTGWVYITAAPLKEIYRQSLFIRNTTIIICAACILLGLLIAIPLSKRMYRPISNIVDYISRADSAGNDSEVQYTTDTNEYKLIISHLDKILEDNKSLKNTLVKDIPFLSDNLFYRILHKSFASEYEVQDSMKKLGITLDKGIFIVMSIKLDAFNLQDGSSYFKSEVLNISDKIIDIIFSMLKQKFKCFYVNEGIYTAFIINLNNDEEEMLMNLCNEISGFLSPDDYRQRVSIGIGGKCTDVMQVCDSYSQSVKALSYITFSKGNQIIIYDENLMNNYSKQFDTNIDLNPIYNSLLAGEFDKGALLSCRIIDQCADKKFPYEQMNKIITQMIHTAVSVLYMKGYSLSDTKLDKNYIYKCVESFVLVEEYEQHIENVFESIGELINSRYNRRKSEIVAHITRYVNENYYKDIYLDSIAAELDMSTNYLSHFFKEITGVSFPDYLGRVRVEEAKKLLGSTDKPIGDISSAVGCTNINTFIRLFKKVEGITPGRYRETLAGLNDEQ